MTVSDVDWAQWYEDVLDGLVAAIETAGIQWATDGDNNPWVVEGQRRPGGIGYPHAMILQFDKNRDEAASKRRHELHRIDTTIAVFREGDPHTPEDNLRQSIRDMGTVETQLYADRSLDRTCDQLDIDSASAFSLENASGNTESVGTIEATITKEAE